MKRAGRTKAGRRVIALALTWDGARYPVRSVPPQARTFLAGPSPRPASFSRNALGRLFVLEDVDEIRICWAPCLKGGPDVLAAPFPAPGKKRILFQAVRQVRFGDHLGVIYRSCGLP